VAGFEFRAGLAGPSRVPPTVEPGSSGQHAAAADILRDTRRHLYQLLAEDPSEPGPESDQPGR
jgi:hypothetical protein